MEASDNMTRLRRLVGCGARLASLAALAALLAGYAWVQVKSFTPGTVEDDCEGYFILGKRLAAGEAPGRVEPDPFVFQSHVWVRNARGELLPKYAPGYPLLVGLAGRVGGDRAAFAVSPVCGGLALAGAWLLFGLWMKPLAAILATTVLATSPEFLDYASYPLAHIPEAAFLVWGCWALWRWVRRPASWGSAVAAGLLLGAAAAVRHTAILFGASTAIAIVAALAVPRDRRLTVALRALALCAAYAVIPTAVAIYQWRWFGGPFTSGYALCGEQTALHWRHAVANYANLNRGIAMHLAFFVAPLGVIGMLVAGPRHERAMRLTAFIGTYLVYVSYYWAPPSMAYYRFLVPLVPLLIGAAFLFLDACLPTAAGRRLALVVTAAICLGRAGPELVTRVREGRLFSACAANQAAAAAAIAPHLDDDAVLFLSRPLGNGMGAFRRYRPYPLDAFLPERIERVMPDEAQEQPAGRDGGRRRREWVIKVQDERRSELTALYDGLGADGLHRRRREVAAKWLRLGRQVAILTPLTQQAQVGRLFPDLEQTPMATFETPSYGEWVLLSFDLDEKSLLSP